MTKKTKPPDKLVQVVEEHLANTPPELPFGDIPKEPRDDSYLNSFDLSQIGTNFEIVEPREAPKPKRARKKAYEKFVRGKSRFVYYVFTPKIKGYRDKIKKSKPINEGSTVSDKERTAWARSLAKNIHTTSRFLETELLPVTSAIHTAVLDSQERYSQLVDDPSAKLPLGFMVKKAAMAAQLKLIDHICDVMGLSTENRRLMKNEYLRLPDPNQTPNTRS